MVFLKAEIASGALSGTMPGEGRLAVDLGVSPKTAAAALRQLENEGFLSSQGRRQGRIISPPEGAGSRHMKVAILLYEPSDAMLPYLIHLHHALQVAGHAVSNANKSLVELKMNLRGVKRLVERTEADAWVVVAGSQEILEWFSERPAPAFALFGRRTSVPIASVGPATSVGQIEATRQLIALGHRRIVRICRSERRSPRPGKTERSFLKVLSEHGILTGNFNLPDWDESPTGFHKLLDSLFDFTPPTALIVSEASFTLAAQQFLGARGLRVPGDVSIVCGEPHPHFAWCNPSVAHVTWNSGLIVRRIVRWATDISRGRENLGQTLIPSKFVTGGTIGAAPAE